MIFQNVCIEALAYVLPDRVVRSDELEQQLAPIYVQLGRSIGRLEQMTGVRERRFWERDTRPSAVGSQAAERAIRLSGVDRGTIGCVITCIRRATQVVLTSPQRFREATACCNKSSELGALL